MIITNNDLNNFQSLFINPNNHCNLDCQMCYVRKDNSQLSYQAISDYINGMMIYLPIKIITFCGGEVFLLDFMSHLINDLIARGLMVEIITNGTLSQPLNKIKKPNNVNLIISIDGLRDFHNLNRGAGSFTRSINFAQKAIKLGFHVEINTIICRENYETRRKFEKELQNLLNENVVINYHIKKNSSYLDSHQTDNINKNKNAFHDLNSLQIKQLYQDEANVFPPADLNCHQISLMSNGQVYSCCERQKLIGTISGNKADIIEKFYQNIVLMKKKAHQCINSSFLCGLNSYFT